MPNLLVAPSTAAAQRKTAEKDLYAPYEGRGADGWYEDGAYVAAPVNGAWKEKVGDGEMDPQEVYYTALLDRFEEVRETLTAPPPPSISAAHRLEPAVRSLLSTPKTRHWKHAFLKSQPTPVLLASLPQEYVVAGIEVLESLLTIRNLRGGVRRKLGIWSWGLLGRCRDVSEMDSEDVGVLRGFGKKACALLRRLKAGEMVDEDDGGGIGAEEEEEDVINNGLEGDGKEMDVEANAMPGDGESGRSHDGDASLEEARSRLLSGILAGDGPATGDSGETAMQAQPNTDAVAPEHVSDAHATLDIIVTIVGECYGQRDLLDGRLAWEEL